MQVLPEALTAALRPMAFRGKLRLLDPLTPRSGLRRSDVFGTAMELDLADDIQRHIYLGTYEPKETAAVRQWLKPGMTFVDVGANVGYFSALAASCVGRSGRVLSLEPQPAVHRQLESMIRRNALTQIESLCAGLSCAPGTLRLFLPADPAAAHNATMVAHPGAIPIAVPVTTLDSCLSDRKIQTVDLLKLDVEGHEPQVLAGASQALQDGRIRAVLCEFNDPWLRLSGSSSRELHRFLLSMGFVDSAGEPDFREPVVNRFLSLHS